jgi:predicted dithiol-disulfide oxidoreductase (DUF899 family)
MQNSTIEPTVVDRSVWLKARAALLAEEKAATIQLDKIAEQRRALPVVRVDKTYTFDTSDGQASLSDLFAGRSQLAVYHFMLGPGWDEGCQSCSYWADNFNGVDMHLAARDTTLLAISRAPLSEINSYRDRMGWDFNWVSSSPSDFNRDFGASFAEGHNTNATFDFAPQGGDPVDETAGMSIFTLSSDGEVFHSYSTFGRGLDIFNGAYQMLDLTPKGRDEGDLPWTMAWLQRHDAYTQ